MPFVSYDPDPTNPGVGIATDDRGRTFDVDIMTTPEVQKLPPSSPPTEGPGAPAGLSEFVGSSSEMSPRAQAVLQKAEAGRNAAGLPPLQVMGSSTTTNVQKGLAPAVLNPLLDATTAQGETDAAAREQLGDQQSARQERAAVNRTGAAFTMAQTARMGEEQAREAQAENVRRQQAAQADAERLTKTEIDPDRYVRNMSTGKSIGTIILATLNGAFKGMVGQQGNDVLDLLKSRIAEDINSQKEQLSSGRLRANNDVAFFRSQGLTLDQAVTAAEARKLGAIAAYTEAQNEYLEAGAAREEGKLLAQSIRAQADLKVKELAATLGADRATTSTTTQSGRPGGGAGSIKDIVAEMLAGRDLQQLARSGLTQDEYSKQAAELVEKGQKARDFKSAVEEAAAAAGGRMVDGQFVPNKGEADVPTKLGAMISKAGRLVGGEGDWAKRHQRAEMAWSRMQRSDVMSMIREPSAVLQNQFAADTERPLFDADIAGQLERLYQVAERADRDVKAGKNPAVVQDYEQLRGGKVSGPEDWK